jgi:predicted transcriptional regulator
MPKVTLKETITKEIEIPMNTLYKIIDNLNEKDRTRLLERLEKKGIELKQFKKDKLEAIFADFEATNLYEKDFLEDLEEGLKKSSLYR